MPSKILPHPAENKVSPTKRIGTSLLKKKAMWDFVCPFTSMTWTSSSNSRTLSPSLTDKFWKGMRSFSFPEAITFIFGHAFMSSVVPPIWSKWWCVCKIASNLRSLFFKYSITGWDTAGSITTTDSFFIHSQITLSLRTLSPIIFCSDVYKRQVFDLFLYGKL